MPENMEANIKNVKEKIKTAAEKSGRKGEEITLVDTSVWGRVPLVQSLVNAFNNDPASRVFQDVGLDGLNDAEEQDFFSDFLDTISSLHGDNSPAYQLVLDDPSQDNFHYFRGSDFDQNETGILDRYRHYNNHQGNSPTSEQSDEPYPTT